MTIKQIDRLTFAQGGLCFFCKQSLSKDEASIEHLVPSAKGGNSNDENCVICCKAVNALFGCMCCQQIELSGFIANKLSALVLVQ